MQEVFSKSLRESDKSLFNDYLTERFKALRCKGYHPRFNPKKDYKTAKEAIDNGFTKDDFSGLSLKEIEVWEKTGGWIGWVIPKGYIAIDAEDRMTIELHRRPTADKKNIKTFSSRFK